MPNRKPKDRMKWLIQHGNIPREYADLGDTIIELAEKKAREPHPHQQFGADQGGGGGVQAGGALSRTSAHQRWERMFRYAGPEGEAIVSAIIVEGMTQEEAAKALNVHHRAVGPLLKFTLGVIGRRA